MLLSRLIAPTVLVIPVFMLSIITFWVSPPPFKFKSYIELSALPANNLYQQTSDKRYYSAMAETITVVVREGDEDIRVDRYLAGELSEFTRVKVTRLIKEKKILMNGKAVLPSRHTKAGDKFEIAPEIPQTVDTIAEDIPLDIVYEDGDIVIVNKAVGMVVHPAKGNLTGTLVNALLHHCKNLSGIGGELRPGIVHRLDKETSGLIAIAKNDTAHLSLSEQLAKHTMGRAYLAVVRGVMREEKGRIEKPIGRHPQHRKKMSVNTNAPKEAVTDFETVETYEEATFLKVKLRTGRTHQIRVHLASINHPILGDMVYGKRRTKLISRPALHAAELRLIHPKTKKEMTFTAEQPEDFAKLLIRLRNMEKP